MKQNVLQQRESGPGGSKGLRKNDSGAPPRLHLRGGDTPRGGKPGSTGHAGRWRPGVALAAISTLCALVVLLAQQPSVAYASTTIHFSNGGTATLNDDGTITGYATTGHFVDGGATLYPVTMPDGYYVIGSCIDYGHYAPYPGTYPFVATPNAQGSYDVIVRSDNSPYTDDGIMEAPPQRLGGFTWSPVLSGKLRLVKASALPQLTNDNASYSLEGARYGVWKNKECTVGTGAAYDLVTGADGVSNEVELTAGTYWVKEAEAPKGYALDPTVYEVSVGGGNLTTVNAGDVRDTPLYEQPTIWANKQDAQYSAAQGSASLEGAEFTFCYYDGTYELDNLPSTPTRTWVVRSDSTGNVIPRDQSIVRGGDLYRNDAGVVVLPLGTITIQETKAPEGYLLEGQDADSPRDYQAPVHLTHVDGSGSFEAIVAKEQVKRAGISLVKVDSETGATPQGDASLEGIEFSIINRNNQAVIVNGTKTEPGETVDQTLVTDENGFAQTSKDCLPLGTYEVVETSTNDSMLNTSKAQTVTLAAPAANTVVPLAWKMKDEVVRGGIAVGKISRETGQHLTQGEAVLSGAVFTITNDSTQAVMVKGAKVAPGAVACTLTTNEDGLASTGARDLPYGTYTVREEEPPEGFLPNPDWSQTVCIREDGKVYDVSGEADSVDDQVMRGGFVFNKVDETSMERMSQVAWRITSSTTGESHVIVSDENGIVDTEAASHTYKTNANDQCVGEGGVNEQALDATAGVWFSGRTDLTTDPNNTMGALPYDVYTVEELRSSVNKDHNLVKFTVRIHQHEVHVEMGTVDDTQVEQPRIGTTLTYGYNDHVAPAGEDVTLLDTIQYEGLVPEKEYTVEGELRNRETGEVFVDANGVPVTATATFVPHMQGGSTTIAFKFNAGACETLSLVAFEHLLLDGQEVASHTELEDEGQTVVFPHVGTSLANTEGSREVSPAERVELVDTVAYENLIPNIRYDLTGTLMDKETGEPLYNDAAQPVQGFASFVPSESSGLAEVVFTFSGALAEGKTLVAFESLARSGTVLAEHKDLDDVEQTVHLPAIQTEFTTKEKSHVVANGGTTTLVDTVAYEGLEAGATYTLEGTLMDKSTNEPLVDEQGNKVVATTTFTAEQASGTTTVAFEINTELLAGSETVAFETLTRDGREVYVHANINDESQTVRTPSIHTTFVSKAGTHEANAEVTTLTDTVSYEGLEANATYTLVATLMDKETEKELSINDKVVTASVQFTAKEAAGSVEVPLTFDASSLAGHTLVAFEHLYEGESNEGEELAKHTDLESAEQTVVLPKLSTTATNAKTKGKELEGEGKVQIHDVVSYEGLTPGETYVITGTLHGKDSGKSLEDSVGAAAVVSKEFVPEKAKGTVEVDFEFALSNVSESGVVVFESCTHNGAEVASHADIHDESQTLTIKRPEKKTAGSAAQAAQQNKAHTPGTGDTSPVFLAAALAFMGASFLLAHKIMS